MSATIYVPGRGMVNLAAFRVSQAVREYDERLTFDRNPDTGYWTIFIAQERPNPPLPVLAFPGSEPPSVDDALKRLYQTDSMRRGQEILDNINRHNKEIQKELERKAQEGTGHAAEALEWGFRKQGVHPNPRIFVSKEV